MESRLIDRALTALQGSKLGGIHMEPITSTPAAAKQVPVTNSTYPLPKMAIVMVASNGLHLYRDRGNVIRLRQQRNGAGDDA